MIICEIYTWFKMEYKIDKKTQRYDIYIYIWRDEKTYTDRYKWIDGNTQKYASIKYI